MGCSPYCPIELRENNIENIYESNQQRGENDKNSQIKTKNFQTNILTFNLNLNKSEINLENNRNKSKDITKETFQDLKLKNYYMEKSLENFDNKYSKNTHSIQSLNKNIDNVSQVRSKSSTKEIKRKNNFQTKIKEQKKLLNLINLKKQIEPKKRIYTKSNKEYNSKIKSIKFNGILKDRNYKIKNNYKPLNANEFTKNNLNQNRLKFRPGIQFPKGTTKISIKQKNNCFSEEKSDKINLKTKQQKSNNNKGKENSIDIINLKPKTNILNIKSKYILEFIFGNLHEKKLFSIIKYNKAIKEKLNINKDYYEDLCKIIIELKPKKESGKFINIEKNYYKFYHIFFNNNEKEIKRNYFDKNDKIKKIKIIIDYQVDSLTKTKKSNHSLIVLLHKFW